MGDNITSCRSSALDGIGLLAPSSPSARALRQMLWLPPNKGLHPTRAARGRVKPGSLGWWASCRRSLPWYSLEVPELRRERIRSLAEDGAGCSLLLCGRRCDFFARELLLGDHDG
jgi:hypothetical protein